MNSLDTLLAEGKEHRWERSTQHEIGGLVEKARSGDQEALEKLYARYTLFVAVLTRRLLKGFHCDAVVEDVYSEAKLAFAEALQRFEADRGNFTSFLRLIVVRRVIAAMRSEIKHWAGDNEPLNISEDPSQPPEAPADPAQLMEQREEVAAMMVGFDWTDEEKAALEFLYARGNSKEFCVAAVIQAKKMLEDRNSNLKQSAKRSKKAGTRA